MPDILKIIDQQGFIYLPKGQAHSDSGITCSIPGGINFTYNGNSFSTDSKGESGKIVSVNGKQVNVHLDQSHSYSTSYTTDEFTQQSVTVWDDGTADNPSIEPYWSNGDYYYYVQGRSISEPWIKQKISKHKYLWTPPFTYRSGIGPKYTDEYEDLGNATGTEYNLMRRVTHYNYYSTTTGYFSDPSKITVHLLTGDITADKLASIYKTKMTKIYDPNEKEFDLAITCS